MTSPDELVAMELARLSANFRAQLPMELRAFEDEVAAWLDAPRDTRCLEILSHRVHQLKGSGSTFGCPGISLAARTLEWRISEYHREVDAGREPEMAIVESAVEQLQNELRRAQTQSRDRGGSP